MQQRRVAAGEQQESSRREVGEKQETSSRSRRSRRRRRMGLPIIALTTKNCKEIHSFLAEGLSPDMLHSLLALLATLSQELGNTV